MWATQIDMNGNEFPKVELKIRNSGINAIWRGTICIAKTMTKTRSRPRHFMKENAYAAITAIASGAIVAGMVMTSELVK